MEHIEAYESIAQRAAASYLRFLARSEDIFAQGPTAGEQQSLTAQHDLYDFFRTFYQALYEDPGRFGLPLVADDAYVDGEVNGTAHKAELNRKLKRPRELISAGLAFLMAVGKDGLPREQDLQIPASEAAHIKKNRGLRTFLQGLSAAGLILKEENGEIYLTNPSFPEMMVALQALARACAATPQPDLGLFHFARCDLRALQPAYAVDALDLYRAFPPDVYQHVAALHAYFVEKKYQVALVISSTAAWMVNYQGKRQVKSTPIFQVEYQERYRNPVILFIKPASTNRIAPSIQRHSQRLQDDFFRRAYYCRGEACGWCKNNKTLGPTPMLRNGEPVVVCWYTNPLVKADEQCVALVKEYIELHEELVK